MSTRGRSRPSSRQAPLPREIKSGKDAWDKSYASPEKTPSPTPPAVTPPPMPSKQPSELSHVPLLLRDAAEVNATCPARQPLR